MPRSLFKLLRIFCGFAIAALFAPGGFCRAAEVTSISVSLTGGDYVIDSGSASNRDKIPVSVTVGLTGPNTEPSRDFRVVFTLFDEQGGTAALASGSNVSNTIFWPSSISGTGVPLPTSVTFTGNLDPTVRLDSNTRYRVQAQVQRRDVFMIY